MSFSCEDNLNNNKDWTGNKNSIFKTLGATNHTDKERQVDDFYATDPIAIDVLLNDGGVKLSPKVWECAAGQGHLSEKLKELTEDNRKDHESFFKSINGLKMDVAILKEKHESDIRLITKNNY